MSWKSVQFIITSCRILIAPDCHFCCWLIIAGCQKKVYQISTPYIVRFFFPFIYSFIKIFKNVIYSYDGKAEFLAAIIPIVSVIWSFRNHSNMPICCSRNIFYYLLKKVVWLWSIFFVDTMILYNQDSWINRKFKRTAFILYIYIYI